MASNRSSVVLSSSESVDNFSSNSGNTDKINLEEDQNWKDVVSDKEDIKVISLFGEETFDTVQSMLKHCKEVHHFDILEVRNKYGLCLCLLILPWYH